MCIASSIKVVFPKSLTVTYERVDKWWWIIVFLGSDSQGITFVASKFTVVSFLCVLDAVSKQ